MNTKILLVESNLGTRMLLAIILQNLDYDVTEASNDKEGLDILRTQSFDWVICNYRLPSSNGVKFLNEVAKSHPEMKQLLISGGDNPLGHNAQFLYKPFSPDQIKAVLEGTPETAPR